MNAVQDRASLHEKAVQKVAKDAVDLPKRTRRSRGHRSSNPKTLASIQDLHPLIQRWIKENGVKISEIKVISSDEIIVH